MRLIFILLLITGIVLYTVVVIRLSRLLTKTADRARAPVSIAIVGYMADELVRWESVRKERQDNKPPIFLVTANDMEPYAKTVIKAVFRDEAYLKSHVMPKEKYDILEKYGFGVK